MPRCKLDNKKKNLKIIDAHLNFFYFALVNFANFATLHLYLISYEKIWQQVKCLSRKARRI